MGLIPGVSHSQELREAFQVKFVKYFHDFLAKEQSSTMTNGPFRD